MSQTIKLKRSSIPGAKPLVGQLELGEIAINTSDGKVFAKINDGTEQVIEIAGRYFPTRLDDIITVDGVATYNLTKNASPFEASLAEAMLVSVNGVTQEPIESYTVSGSTITFIPALSSTDVVDYIVDLGKAIPISQELNDVVETVGEISKDLTGFVNRTDSSLSFDAGTRTLTLTPQSTAIVYYKGKEFSISSPLSIIISTTAGGRYIRFDPTTQQLVEKPVGTFADFKEDILVAYIYWDGTQAIIFGDERHGADRDTQWHVSQHLDVGAVWRRGGDITYVTDDDAQTSLGFTDIQIADEDVVHDIVHSAAPAAPYEQIISTNAQLPVIYLNGTTYTQTSPSAVPWLAGANRAQYNSIVAETGSLVEAANGKFICYWVIATNDSINPLKLVAGQVEHNNENAAINETFSDYGLPLPEVVPMYKVILNVDDTNVNNSAKVTINSVYELYGRQSSALQVFDTVGTSTDYINVATFTDGTLTLSGEGDAGASVSLDGRYQLASEKGAANGYASLDSEGKVPTTQLPALALTDVSVVADEAARLALTVEEGDVAIQSDTGSSYIYDGASWLELSSTETDPIFTGSTVSNITDGTGFLVNDGAGNWSYDNTNYLSAVPAEYLTETEGDARYLQSFTESDPVFTGSTVSNITDGTGFLVNDGAGNWSYDNTNYLSAVPAEYLTETEGDARYLQSFTETDTLESVTGRGASSTNAINITNTTTSTSSSQGALTVTGGVGIAENLNVGGSITVQKYFIETYSNSGSISSGTSTFDLANGSVFSIVASGSFNAVFDSVPPAGGVSWTLRVTNNGTAHTIGWPVGILWSGGEVPPPSTGVDIYTFFSIEGTVYGSLSVRNAS